MADRQKLAETVREAMGERLMIPDPATAALDALAQPCQECEALREKLAEQDRVYGDFELEAATMHSRLETAERERDEAREALRKIASCRCLNSKTDKGSCDWGCVVCTARAALAATEPVIPPTRRGGRADA